MVTKFSQSELSAFSEAEVAFRTKQMSDSLARDFPDLQGRFSDDERHNRVKNLVKRARQSGFTKNENIYILAAWDLHYGPRFETRDPDGTLVQILTGPLSEDQRLAKTRARLETLFGQGHLG